MSTTRKARGVLALVMAVGMLMTLLVVPSSAETPSDGVATFRGRAAIGPASGHKPKTGDPQELPTSGCNGVSGLHFPGVAPGKDVCYEFEAPDPVRSGKPPAAGAFCESDAGPCTIYAAGLVGPAAIVGEGAHCGISKGTDGNGLFTVPGAGLALKLYNLEWNFPLSAGGTFVVTGEWRNLATDDPRKKGTLTAIIQASGTTNDDLPLVVACAFANGATSFDVNGLAFL